MGWGWGIKFFCYLVWGLEKLSGKTGAGEGGQGDGGKNFVDSNEHVPEPST